MSAGLLTYDQLIETGLANQQYLENRIPNGAEKTANMLWQVMDRMQRRIPQIQGGFGLGYPFHSMSEDLEATTNPEFSRYTEEFINKAVLAKEMSQTAIWQCSPCQRRIDYSPSDCGSCELSMLKPREVMKALPDLDMFLISSDIAPATLANIQSVAHDEGFSQSDFDASGAIGRINNVLTAFGNDDKPKEFLPVDIHVTQLSDVIDVLGRIQAGETTVRLPIRSMYAGWKANQKIDFWFDFVFSGTFNPQLCTPILTDSVAQARRGLTDSYQNHEIEELVRAKSRRASVLLDYGPTRQLFWDKLSSWRTDD